MRSVSRAVLLLAAVMSSACFQMTTVLKVNADGSGTLEHRMVYTNAGLAQLRQFTALGGGRAQSVDPTSEQQARDLVTSIGPGVTYVSSTPVTTATGRGRDAIYAFTDVTQLRISTQPAAPAGITARAGGFSTQGGSVTFTMTHEANGNAILHIVVPEPDYLNALGSPQAASQIGMVKQLLGGAKILLAAEPSGTLVKTSSPYVDGSRVTLLEIDLDEVLKDQTLMPRLQAATTQDEAKAVIKSAAGLKINLDRDITIEFTPAK
jgi:hypothetical protein